jgi:O-antigen ligase
MNITLRNNGLVSLLFAIFLIASVGVDHGAGISGIAILLISIVGLIATKNQNYDLLESWEWVWILSIIAFIGMISQGHGDFDYLDSSSRLLLAIPVYLFIRRVGININAVFIGSILGAIVAGGYSWYQYEHLNLSMSLGVANNHIFFGQVALILTMFSFCSAVVSKKTINTLLSVVGVLCGLYAVIVSGSRGGWLAIPAIFLFLFSANVWHVSKLKIVVVAVLLFFTSIGVYNIDKLPVKSRVDRVFTEVDLYFTKDNVQPSVGSRLEMWKGAFLIAKDSNFLGVGESNYDSAQQKLRDDGRVNQKMLRWDPHNLYLNVAAKQGIFGLLALLSIMLVPLRLFFKDAVSNSASKNTSIMGGMLIVSYLDFMLTTSTFIYQFMTLFFAFLLVALLGNLTNKKSTTI